MKKSTVTKFETSDGREFTDPHKAQEHEITLLSDSLRTEDEKRLTYVGMTRMMSEHPQKFIDLLSTFEGVLEDSAAHAAETPAFKSVQGKSRADKDSEAA